MVTKFILFVSFPVEFNANKSWLNNRNKKMLGSKTVGGHPRGPKMASGRRALTAADEDSLLERWFKLIKLDLRYVRLIFYLKKLWNKCKMTE